jgi:hypothetical protein
VVDIYVQVELVAGAEEARVVLAIKELGVEGAVRGGSPRMFCKGEKGLESRLMEPPKGA